MDSIKHLLLPISLPCLILICGAANALDTDGDGIPDKAVGQVSAGYFHSCAVDVSGVRCWGKNWYGQTDVPPLVNPVAVSAGYGHTCALDDKGVHCWGQNNLGQTNVPKLNRPTAVSVGAFHTCALDAKGMHCWGGFPTVTGETIVPKNLVKPRIVGAGYGRTCVLDANGVSCWGQEVFGENSVPVLTSPEMVSVGSLGYHTCAIDSRGVHCWGADEYGQSDVPPNLVKPTFVSAGGVLTCALTATGVKCWGDNWDDSGPDWGQTVPALVKPIAVSAGQYHACALDANGVHCWGDNADGQIDVPAGLEFAKGDNCPLVANPNQLDTDGDGVGDVCDAFPYDSAIFGSGVVGGIKTDKTGTAVAFAGDFNGDGYGDYVIGIPDFDLSTKIKNAGRAEVISGTDGSVLAFINGIAAKDAMGIAVAGGGDINNDGFDDVVVGAPLADHLPLKDSGSVTVLYGRADINPVNLPNQFFYGATAKTLFGSAVALGDLDNDGHAEIIIGAPKDDDTAHRFVDAGSVTILDHNGAQIQKYYGAAAKDYFGSSVAVGKINNDANGDVIVGSPNADDVTNKRIDAGKVTVFSSSGTTEIFHQYGTVAKAYFGKSVAAGDVNKDGFDDVLVGAIGDDNGKLKDVGSVTVFSGSDGSQLTKKIGEVAKAGLGNSVAAGDINGDGYADIIAGASKDDKPATKVIKDAGSVSVWSGNGYAQIGSTLYGDVSKDYFGTSISTGDINGDGKADLIIGIPGYDLLAIKPVKDAGMVKVLSGAGL